MRAGELLQPGLGHVVAAAVFLLGGCGRPAAPPAPPPVEVTVTTVAPRDVPIVLQYVGQTESSRLVEIRARVDGYLQKKFFVEGLVVREGASLFQIDPTPLQLAADSANAAVQDKEAYAQNARQSLDRLRPLLEENAVSRKDYDDATAQERSATAALAAAKADAARAKTSLSYALITSPLTGLAGRANVAEGTYVSPGANGLLTTVAQVDPIWVSFSVSENEWNSLADEAAKGRLRLPEGFGFDVSMALPGGRAVPAQGKINFASPSVDAQTGTYALRATFPNPDLAIRPGQFVHLSVKGATRPAAILVPQRAVMQGQTGKFVYVVTKAGTAEARPVEVGNWHGGEWFINSGLRAGEQVVVDGVVKVQPGAPVKVVTEPAKGSAAAAELSK
jgi:membrane fusion protein (multidrug efflux system)